MNVLQVDIRHQHTHLQNGGYFNPICYCNADGEVLTTLKVSIDQVHVMSLTFCDTYKSLYLIHTAISLLKDNLSHWRSWQDG